MKSVIPFPAPLKPSTSLLSTAAGGSGVVPATEVRQQLAKITGSAGFARAPRITRFLVFVVEETLAGRAGQLCEYSIGISVFDRTESFEPGIDPIVRNDARRLRNKLLEYYQTQRDPRDRRVVIEVPKGAYVPVFSFAASSSQERGSAPYRLSVSLTRIADGFELLSKTYDLESGACSLKFEFESLPAVALGRNSSPARLNQSV